MKKIEAIMIDWPERYKRLLDACYNTIHTARDYVEEKWGREAGEEFSKMHQGAMSPVVGKKLVEKLNLKPNVEGALKLLITYSQEVWGFGDSKFVEAWLETPTKGTYANLVCRSWEKDTKNRKPPMDCVVGCQAEYQSLVKCLSPNIKVTFTKVYPWGDDRCEMTVEAVED